SDPLHNYKAGRCDQRDRMVAELAAHSLTSNAASVVATVAVTGIFAATATTEAARAVSRTTRDAATRVGEVVTEATSRVKKQFSNEEANSRLRADAALRMELVK